METTLNQQQENRTHELDVESAKGSTVLVIDEERFPMFKEVQGSFPSRDQTIEGGSLGSEFEQEKFHLQTADQNTHGQLETFCNSVKVEREDCLIKDASGNIEKRNKEDGSCRNYQVVLVSDKDLIAEEFGHSLKEVVTNVLCEQLPPENQEKCFDLESQSVDEESDDISDRYLCHICGKAYKQLSHLSRHTKSAHKSDNIHQCNFCNATFTRSESLIRHLKLHEQRMGSKPRDGPYKCPLCSKTYQQPYNVSRHLLTHSGEKPFQCLECDKKFTQHTGLARHLVLHRGSKDFKCDVCGKAFARQFVLSRHKLTHTDDKPYKCFACSKSFIRASQLEIHIKGHKRADNGGPLKTTVMERHGC